MIPSEGIPRQNIKEKNTAIDRSSCPNTMEMQLMTSRKCDLDRATSEKREHDDAHHRETNDSRIDHIRYQEATREPLMDNDTKCSDVRTDHPVQSNIRKRRSMKSTAEKDGL